MEREAEKSEIWLIITRDRRWSSGVGGNGGGKGFQGVPKAVARDDMVS